ncbi:MAG TPA: hypothetical protein VKY85_15670 [Candidatus Angelobacter sp.]|nr:hypothetical protein [Candidatus Angelobacter sp.]
MGIRKFVTEMPLPWLQELPQLVAASGIGGTDALWAGVNVEGGEEAGDLGGGEGTVYVPGTMGHGLHPVQQVGGGEAFGEAVAGQVTVDVIEELQAGLEIEDDLFFEDRGQGLAGAGGPFGTDGVGQLEERFDQVLATGGEAGRKVLCGVGLPLFQIRQILLGPGLELLSQRLGFLRGTAQVEALDSLVRGRRRLYPVALITRRTQIGARSQWLENDTDRAVGEGFRELAHSGKGFGTKNVALLRAGGVAGAAMIAAGKESTQSRTLATGTGADRGLAFIEQDGGDNPLFHTASKGGSGKARSKGRMITEQVEQLQAESLTGLLVQGLDGEIWGDLSRRQTVGVEDPESHDGTLIVGTVQVTSDEFAYL